MDEKCHFASDIFFIVILFYIERKWLVMRNLAKVLPLKFKCPKEFQCFNTIGGSIKMLKYSWTSKNFNLNEKF